MRSLLIAVESCNNPAYYEKRKAQRDTWANKAITTKDGWLVEIVWFVGNGRLSHSDEIGIIQLPCDDTYAGLAQKTHSIVNRFLQTNYDYLLKVDDDIYLQVDRLIELLNKYPLVPDYAGRLRGPSGTKPAPYASGFCYLLSRKAAQAVADNFYEDTAEDRMVGNIMQDAKISCEPWWNEFVITSSKKNAITGNEGPRAGNRVVACAEYSVSGLYQVHNEWLTLPSGCEGIMAPAGTPFDDVCIIIKTFLRDGLLMKTIKGIEENLPGARMIIVDDGRDSSAKITEYARLRKLGHSCIWMPFDSGFGAKSNVAVSYCDRKYALIASDDFVFDKDAADGVLKLVTVLEGDRNFGVASGRVDNNPYEGWLRYTKREDGTFDVVAERLDTTTVPCTQIGDIRYWRVGHTVNYNLCRVSALSHVRWDEKFKIGGDHARFYEQLDRAGVAIAYVEGVSITQAKAQPEDVHPDYAKCRGRARLALPTTYREMGWNSFTHFDGLVETLEDTERWVANNQMPSGEIAAPRVFNVRAKKNKP